MVRTFIYLAILLASASLFADVKGIKVVETKSAPLEIYENSHALLIGASNYSSAWPDLVTVPAELAKLEKVLIQQQFSITKVLNPTSEELEDAFENFIDKHGYDPKNRLLFYFSGHGFTRASGTKGYLVPTDAPHPNKDETNFVRSAFSMTSLLALAREIESTHALFLFDSCFSGTIFKTRSLPSSPPLITSLTKKPVRQFITAGDAGEAVPAKSIFTPAITDGLEHGLADLNEDGFVTGSELGMYLQSTISKASSGAQSPQYGKINDYDLSLGDFVFQVPTEEKVESPAPEVVQYQGSDFSLSDLKQLADEDRKRKEEELIDAFRKTETFVNSTSNKSLQSTAWNRFVENFKNSATLGSEGVRLLAVAEEKLTKIRPKETSNLSSSELTENLTSTTSHGNSSKPEQQTSKATNIDSKTVEKITAQESGADESTAKESGNQTGLEPMETDGDVVATASLNQEQSSAEEPKEQAYEAIEERKQNISSTPPRTDEHQDSNQSIGMAAYRALRFYAKKESLYPALLSNMQISIIADTYPQKFSQFKGNFNPDSFIEDLDKFTEQIANEVPKHVEALETEVSVIREFTKAVKEKTSNRAAFKTSKPLPNNMPLQTTLFSLSVRTLYVSAFSRQKMRLQDTLNLNKDRKILLNLFLEFFESNKTNIDIRLRTAITNFIISTEDTSKWSAVGDRLITINGASLNNSDQVSTEEKINVLAAYHRRLESRALAGRYGRRSGAKALQKIARDFFDQSMTMSLDKNNQVTLLTLVPLRSRFNSCISNFCEPLAPYAQEIYDVVQELDLPAHQLFLAKLQLADSYTIDGIHLKANETYLSAWKLAQTLDDDAQAILENTEPLPIRPDGFQKFRTSRDSLSPIAYKIQVEDTGRVETVKRLSKITVPTDIARMASSFLSNAIYRPALVKGQTVPSEFIHMQKFEN